MRKLSKKTKIITLVIAAALLIFGGTIFALAKTGKLKMLADTIIPKSTRTTGSIKAIVKDASQNPVNNATAFITTEAGGSLQSKNVNSGGVALFQNLIPGQWVVWTQIGLPLCSSQPVHKTVVANQTAEVNLTLPLTCTNDIFSISGRVTSTDGSNLSGVLATLTIIGNSFSASATTNSQGQYQIGNIPIVSGIYAADYKIKYEKNDYQTQTKNFNNLAIPTGGWPLVAGSNYAAATVALVPIGTPPPPPPAQTATFDFLGTVRDESGAILPGAGVTLTCKTDKNVCKSKPNYNRWVPSRTDTQTTDGYQQNYLIADYYNIAQSGSNVTELFAQVAKDGYYYDANNNGVKDSNEKGWMTIKRSDIFAPGASGNTSSKSVLNKNFVLKSVPMAQPEIYGRVVKAENNNKGVTANIFLVPGEDPSAATIQTPTDSKGNYRFTNLTG